MTTKQERGQRFVVLTVVEQGGDRIGSAWANAAGSVDVYHAERLRKALKP